jgi:hypothetical protein
MPERDQRIAPAVAADAGQRAPARLPLSESRRRGRATADAAAMQLPRR